ncbi:hypothetical protein [Leucobacter luti]|uniref:hypothetical protein n=1 Tax=Leucobacter luti TaxID=340320 RepID=UPI001C68FB74|nr:hypothetical protein [Leucobacter luti]QYM76915.1 hypothetical protein K1X41_05935 [Leucobacter luti]
MNGGELAVTTVLVIVVASWLLRRMTLWLNKAAFAVVPPLKEPLLYRAGRPLIVFAWTVSVIAVGGALVLPYPGLWGPAVLVFSVVWTINRKTLVAYISWLAPVDIALEKGDRIVLLGGAAGTLVAYVATIPV